MLAQIQGQARISNCVFVQIFFELLDFLARLKFRAPRPAVITGKQTFDYADLPRLGNQSFNWVYQEKLWLTISTISCKQLLYYQKMLVLLISKDKDCSPPTLCKLPLLFVAFQLQDINLGRGESDIAKKETVFKCSDRSVQIYVKRKITLVGEK